MKEEKVFIPSAGIQLEGLLSIQEASSFRGGVILCHPHPQKSIYSICRDSVGRPLEYSRGFFF